MSSRHLVGRVRAFARIDLTPTHRPPAVARVVLATAAAVVVSLLVDWALVRICVLAFPSTRHFSHFRLWDYGLLTIIGVSGAGLGWLVVTRVTASPRWLLLRLAVLVTLVLWLPDGWLLLRGEPARAVAVLMVMHLAIALVTYNFLVHGAPVGRAGNPPLEPGFETTLAVVEASTETGSTRRPEVPPERAGVAPPAEVAARSGGPGQSQEEARAPAVAPGTARLFVIMAAATGVELLLGLAGLILVPLGRPTEWLPAKGEMVYVAHAVVGAALAVGGLLLLARTARAHRLARMAAWIGAVGLVIGVVGGVLASYHPARLAGMGLMLAGAMVAGFGYLMPVVA
jgi:hypothetical protein